ncbi:MAG: hypothetical protein AB7T22_17070 [Calditrichaceae bacterium]
MNKKKILKLLYRSFDEQLSPKDEKLLADYLKGSEWLRSEHKRTERIRQKIISAGSQNFKPFFAERVLRRLDEATDRERAFDIFSCELFVVFKRVTFASVLLIAGIISWNITKSDHLSLRNAFSVPEITIEKVFEPFNQLGTE